MSCKRSDRRPWAGRLGVRGAALLSVLPILLALAVAGPAQADASTQLLTVNVVQSTCASCNPGVVVSWGSGNSSSANQIECPTVNPGIGLSCSEPFASGSVVTLTAKPPYDSLVSSNGWSGACSGASTTCTVTMNGDQTVGATFDQAPALAAGVRTVLEESDTNASAVGTSSMGRFPSRRPGCCRSRGARAREHARSWSLRARGTSPATSRRAPKPGFKAEACRSSSPRPAERC